MVGSLTSGQTFRIGAYDPHNVVNLNGDLFETRLYNSLEDEVALHAELDAYYNPPVNTAPGVTINSITLRT